VSIGVIVHTSFHSHVGAVVRACNYHTRALRHVRKHLTTENGTGPLPAATRQLAAVWCSYYSRRDAAVNLKRHPGHLSTGQLCPRQTAIEVSSLAGGCLSNSASSTNSGHHAQGSMSTSVPPYIDELLQRQRSTRQVTTWSLAAVHRCSASLSAVDTHWDSQVSVLSGVSERLELTTERHSQRQFLVKLPCQAHNIIGIIFITAPWREMKTRLDAVFSYVYEWSLPSNDVATRAWKSESFCWFKSLVRIMHIFLFDQRNCVTVCSVQLHFAWVWLKSPPTLFYKSTHGANPVYHLRQPTRHTRHVEPTHLPHFPLAQTSINTRTSSELLSTGMLFLTQPVQHHLLIPSEQHSTDYPPLHPTPTGSSMTLRQ